MISYTLLGLGAGAHDIVLQAVSVKMHSILRSALAASCLISNVFSTALPSVPEKRAGVIKPKIFIISMFSYEEEAWQGIPDFDIYEKNVTIPGFSPIYPDAHCTASGEICQFTLGESGMHRLEHFI
jgi:purine nucleoside permease